MESPKPLDSHVSCFGPALFVVRLVNMACCMTETDRSSILGQSVIFSRKKKKKILPRKKKKEKKKERKKEEKRKKKGKRIIIFLSAHRKLTREREKLTNTFRHCRTSAPRLENGGERKKEKKKEKKKSTATLLFFLEVVFAPTPALADALTGGPRFSQGINKVCYAKKKKERKKERKKS